MEKTSGVVEKISGKGLRFGVVVSRFNAAVTDKLLEGALRAFREAGVAVKDVRVVTVPGAFEIPSALQVLAKTKKYEGLVALGAVIRGETPHFDYVCRAATDGVLRVSLDEKIPVAFGVLTVDTMAQATDRIGGRYGHKGEEAALTAIEMAKVFGKKGSKRG